MARWDETEVEVVYVRSDGAIVIERPGLRPVLVVVDDQKAAEKKHVPPREGPRKPYIIPKPNTTYVRMTRPEIVLEAARVDE